MSFGAIYAGGLFGSLRGFGGSSSLYGHYQKLASQMSLANALAKFSDDGMMYKFHVGGMEGVTDRKFFLVQGWHGEEMKSRVKTRVTFPLYPGGFLMWACSLFGHDRILRWFLTNTDICDGQGVPIQFESLGLKIQNARALFNLVIMGIDHGGIIETQLGESHHLRKYTSHPATCS